MAKDGTMRGGARVGSGRKSKALAEKIDSGLAATVIDLPEPEDITGEDVPPVKDFLKAAQKSGIDLCADIPLAEGKRVREAGEHSADRTVRDVGIQMGTVRDLHIGIRISGEASDHGGGDNFSVCDDEPELSEAGEPVLVSNLSDCEGKLLRGVRRRKSA